MFTAAFLHMTSPLTTGTDINEIVENFSFLDNWDDRYGYLIELGRQLTPLADEEMIDINKVQGCVSQVWVVAEHEERDGETVLHFRGASDAHIVRGLVAIALALFSGHPAKHIATLDEQSVFSEIGLKEHLTPQRSNGLRSLVQRLKAIASAAA